MLLKVSGRTVDMLLFEVDQGTLLSPVGVNLIIISN